MLQKSAACYKYKIYNTFDFHFNFVEDNLQILQFHVDSIEVSFSLIHAHFHIEYFIQLVATSHLFYFSFGCFLKQFKFCDFTV